MEAKPRGLLKMEDGVGTLVVDSGALIKGAPIRDWSQNVVTVKEILAEVRDLNTRRRLQVLPFDISFREPSHEALQHVTSFAKKTGDFVSLSRVDLRLLALTYQLECEEGAQRGTNLRADPPRLEPISTETKPPTIVGFYSGPKKLNDSTNESDRSQEHSKLSHDQSERYNKPHDEIAFVPVEDLEKLNLEDIPCSENTSSTVTPGSSNVSVQDAVGLNKDNLSEKRDDILERNGDIASDLESNEGSKDSQNEDSDDEDSWITPGNYQMACEQMGGALDTGLNGIAVGCVTTDYAMQNVLLQMGLNVISVDGMRVKQLRTYAMKCKACFKVTSNTGLLFCPHCGNKALMKVAMVMSGEEGTVQYRVLSQKQCSHKGLKYSLPLPKGGRHANNPILAPDQRETSKQRRTRGGGGGGRTDPMHPDYIAQTSPFAMNDVNSRGAQIRFAQGRGFGSRAGWRNNPNTSRPKGRKK